MSQTQVQSGFIGDNSVTTTQIATSAITSAKIADGNVTTAKLDSTVSGALVPIGGIIMWGGEVATIPSSWRLCNGANGTPNLQDRFVVGAGSGYIPGNNGGSATATLVSHTHNVNNETASGPQWIAFTRQDLNPSGPNDGSGYPGGGRRQR